MAEVLPLNVGLPKTAEAADKRDETRDQWKRNLPGSRTNEAGLPRITVRASGHCTCDANDERGDQCRRNDDARVVIRPLGGVHFPLQVLEWIVVCVQVLLAHASTVRMSPSA